MSRSAVKIQPFISKKLGEAVGPQVLLSEVLLVLEHVPGSAVGACLL